MNLRVILLWAGVAFLLWWVIQQPQSASHLLSNIGDFLRSASFGLSNFVKKI